MSNRTRRRSRRRTKQRIARALTLFILFSVFTIVVTAWCNRNAEAELDETVTASVTPAVHSITVSASMLDEPAYGTEPVEETVSEIEPGYLHSEDIPLPEYLQETMQRACEEYGVSYSLALAIAERESSFDLEADSGVCWGLMQINPINYAWLRELGIEPTEYEGNIVAGVLIIGQLLDKYGDTHKALMAYNCGESGAARLWEQGYYTTSYSRNVIESSEYWQQIINGNIGG